MANTNAQVILPSGIGDVRVELYEIGGTGMVNTLPSGDVFIEMSGNLSSYSGVFTQALDGFYQGIFFGPDELLWAKYHIHLEDTTDWYIFGDYNHATPTQLKTFEPVADVSDVSVDTIVSGVWLENPDNYTGIYSMGSGIQKCFEDILFADVKQYKDITGINDEYGVIWFKNGMALNSGDISDPAISVYNTVDGAAVFENQTLDFAGTLGALRYNETTAANHLASGEPYMVITSGTIESKNRTWKKVIGLDYLY